MIITLDPGHGQYGNPGAISGYFEGTRVFFLAGYLKGELEKYDGVTVYLTRASITDDPSLAARGATAVKNGSELFISLHTNGFSSSAARGVSMFRSVKLPDSAALAQKLEDAVVGVMRPVTGVTYSRGIATRTYESAAGKTLDYYGVIRSAVASDKVKYAYIIEHGFHSNLTECAYLNSDDNLKAIAAAEAKVIAEYFGLKKADAEAEETDGYSVYTVAAGDTLTKIALKYDTTWRALAEYNALSDPDLIHVGDKIRIPAIETFRAGDIVRLKRYKSTYYPDGNPFKSWVADYNYAIEKTADSKGSPVYRNGSKCVLLGKRIDRETGQVYASIKSWASVDYIEKA